MDEQSESEDERGGERERERRASFTEAGRLARRSRSPLARSIPCVGMQRGGSRDSERQRPAADGGTARYGSGGSFVATFYAYMDTRRRRDGVA